MQDWDNSIADALKLLQSCAKSAICCGVFCLALIHDNQEVF